MKTAESPTLTASEPQSNTPIPAATRVSQLLLIAGSLAYLIFPLAPVAGLIGGTAIALTLGNTMEKLTAKSSSMILKIAVVLLGAGMNLGTVWHVGAGGVDYTMIGICFTLALGLWLGRRAHLSHDTTLLISTGTAICGGSAIAAMSAAIKPKAHDVAVAMASVFLLNAVALVLFPWIGHTMGFSQEQFGMWAALAIHDTSSVVGAATSYGAIALSIAVTVKLTRALWIVPVTAFAGWWHARKHTHANADTLAQKSSMPLKRFMPQPFIIGYLLMASLFTYVPGLSGGVIASYCGTAAHRLMTLALFLIGAGLSRAALKQTGAKPLGVAIVLWVVVSTLTVAALKCGLIVAPSLAHAG